MARVDNDISISHKNHQNVIFDMGSIRPFGESRLLAFSGDGLRGVVKELSSGKRSDDPATRGARQSVGTCIAGSCLFLTFSLLCALVFVHHTAPGELARFAKFRTFQIEPEQEMSVASVLLEMDDEEQQAREEAFHDAAGPDASEEAPGSVNQTVGSEAAVEEGSGAVPQQEGGGPPETDMGSVLERVEPIPLEPRLEYTYTQLETPPKCRVFDKGQKVKARDVRMFSHTSLEYHVHWILFGAHVTRSDAQCQFVTWSCLFRARQEHARFTFEEAVRMAQDRQFTEKHRSFLLNQAVTSYEQFQKARQEVEDIKSGLAIGSAGHEQAAQGAPLDTATSWKPERMSLLQEEKRDFETEMDMCGRIMEVAKSLGATTHGEPMERQYRSIFSEARANLARVDKELRGLKAFFKTKCRDGKWSLAWECRHYPPVWFEQSEDRLDPPAAAEARMAAASARATQRDQRGARIRDSQLPEGFARGSLGRCVYLPSLQASEAEYYSAAANQKDHDTLVVCYPHMDRPACRFVALGGASKLLPPQPAPGAQAQVAPPRGAPLLDLANEGDVLLPVEEHAYEANADDLREVHRALAHDPSLRHLLLQRLGLDPTAPPPPTQPGAEPVNLTALWGYEAPASRVQRGGPEAPLVLLLAVLRSQWCSQLDVVDQPGVLPPRKPRAARGRMRMRRLLRDKGGKKRRAAPPADPPVPAAQLQQERYILSVAQHASEVCLYDSPGEWPQT